MVSRRRDNIYRKRTKGSNKGNYDRNGDKVTSKYFEVISMAPICTGWKLERDLRKYSVIQADKDKKIK